MRRPGGEWVWVICGGAVGLVVVLAKIGLRLLPVVMKEVQGL